MRELPIALSSPIDRARGSDQATPLGELRQHGGDGFTGRWADLPDEALVVSPPHGELDALRRVAHGGDVLAHLHVCSIESGCDEAVDVRATGKPLL